MFIVRDWGSFFPVSYFIIIKSIPWEQRMVGEVGSWTWECQQSFRIIFEGNGVRMTREGIPMINLTFWGQLICCLSSHK